MHHPDTNAGAGTSHGDVQVATCAHPSLCRSQSVVATALMSYVRSDSNAPRVALEAVRVVVDGTSTTGKQACFSYLKTADAPVRITLTLPFRVVEEAPSTDIAHAGKHPPSSALAKAGAAAEKAYIKKLASDDLKFIVDVQTEDGETLSSIGAVLPARLLSQSLTKALVIPALKEYERLHDAAIDESFVRVIVNGHSIPRENCLTAKCSSFARAKIAPISVVLVVPAGAERRFSRGRKLVDARFVIEVVAHDGEIQTYDVRLDRKSLAKPLMKSLVVPALKHCGYLSVKPTSVALRVNGSLVDGATITATFVNANAVEESCWVRMQLPDPLLVSNSRNSILARTSSAASSLFKRRPSVLRASVQGAATPSTTTSKIDCGMSFQVSIGDGISTWERQTYLKPRFVHKTLKDGLITPALKAYFRDNPGTPQVKADTHGLIVEIDGSIVNISTPISACVQNFGTWSVSGSETRKVNIRLPIPSHSAPLYDLSRISRST